jgi:hypothetical protein
MSFTCLLVLQLLIYTHHDDFVDLDAYLHQCQAFQIELFCAAVYVFASVRAPLCVCLCARSPTCLSLYVLPNMLAFVRSPTCLPLSALPYVFASLHAPAVR